MEALKKKNPPANDTPVKTCRDTKMLQDKTARALVCGDLGFISVKHSFDHLFCFFNPTDLISFSSTTHKHGNNYFILQVYYGLFG